MNKYVIDEETLKAAIQIVGEAPAKMVGPIWINLQKLPQYIEETQDATNAKEDDKKEAE